MKRVLFVLIISLFFAGCYNGYDFKNVELTKVTVYSNNMDELAVLTDSKKLDQLKKIIAASGIVDAPGCKWEYKIDIVLNNESGRWLYNSDEGYLAKLNYQLQPCFLIKDRAGLNKIIQIK